ncbi:phospholipase A1 VesT1.02-like [Anopheles aquasalis]|uniref:phospholipase A1 VesT1.02-like n=1 Tax=Anopheles aquasalis TaxID=42839 RepID=UPI00215ACD10|nr:phospholipase A1 VesT1.02-like [Anopheles aquasalis]
MASSLPLLVLAWTLVLAGPLELPWIAHPAAATEGSDWIAIPTAGGDWVWTHRKAISRKSTHEVGDVAFILYTTQDIGNTGYRLDPSNAAESIAVSNFGANRPTRVIVHGWLNSADSPVARTIRETYLLQWNYNVIVVDWSVCAMAWNYAKAVGCVPMVGKALGGLLDELQRNGGLLLEDVYLIGHSLGAHVAGIAGKTVTTGQIHTIFALDPALPLFSIHSPENRIGVRDAMYVEVIHTNAGLLGFQHPIGTADFYPNGGSHQPGCGLNIAGLCSHSRAWELFVETLLEPEDKLLASRVASLDDVQRPPGLQGVQGDAAVERAKIGGEPSSAGNARGLYRITTRDRSPFFA